MFYSEVGFRAIYHNFVTFPLNDQLKESCKELPDFDQANCLLCYGYIDNEAGLSLEVIAGGDQQGESFRFFDSDISLRTTIRIGAVEDLDFFLINNDDGDLTNRYKEKIDLVTEFFDKPENLVNSRDMFFLDTCRHNIFPDDVLVKLIRRNRDIEECWVRITDLGDHYFIGTLLNEPNQDFGYHEGETIGFFADQNEETKEVILFSDMNPSQTMKREDFEDGKLLRAAIEKLYEENSNDNLFDVFEILRDSYLWVPCNTRMSERDQERFMKMIDEAGDDIESLIDKNFVNEDEIAYVPDILTDNEEKEFFFPAFTNQEAMGEYGDNFSKVEMPFLQIAQLARNNEKNVSGILIDAFTNQFMLNNDFIEMIEQMKSRVEDEE